jgi:hypothetical protein
LGHILLIAQYITLTLSRAFTSSFSLGNNVANIKSSDQHCSGNKAFQNKVLRCSSETKYRSDPIYYIKNIVKAKSSMRLIN